MVPAVELSRIPCASHLHGTGMHPCVSNAARRYVNQQVLALDAGHMLHPSVKKPSDGSSKSIVVYAAGGGSAQRSC